MTLYETLKIKFQDKLRNENQLKTFNKCIEALEKHYAYACKKSYNGVEASFNKRKTTFHVIYSRF